MNFLSDAMPAISSLTKSKMLTIQGSNRASPASRVWDLPTSFLLFSLPHLTAPLLTVSKKQFYNKSISFSRLASVFQEDIVKLDRGACLCGRKHTFNRIMSRPYFGDMESVKPATSLLLFFSTPPTLLPK